MWSDDGDIEVRDRTAQETVESDPAEHGPAATESPAAEASLEAGPTPDSPDGQAASPSPAFVKQLEEHVAFLTSRLEEAERKNEQTLAAARAREQELERVKERLEREREKKLFREKSRVFARLLEPFDNLERCLAAASLSGDIKAMLDGVALVQKGILDALVSVGLQRFDPTGQPFDPECHEAIGVVLVDDPSLAERVHATYLAGYRLDDQVIRHARVLVARNQT